MRSSSTASRPLRDARVGRATPAADEEWAAGKDRFCSTYNDLVLSDVHEQLANIIAGGCVRTEATDALASALKLSDQLAGALAAGAMRNAQLARGIERLKAGVMPTPTLSYEQLAELPIGYVITDVVGLARTKARAVHDDLGPRHAVFSHGWSNPAGWMMPADRLYEECGPLSAA